jgi:CHAD domain-containing protein
MQFEFIIPDGTGVDDLQASLQQACRIQTEPAHTVRRTFYDSFDWRIYNAGMALHTDHDGSTWQLQWRPLNGSSQHPPLTLSAEPHFAWDLPPGPQRSELADVLEMREIAPLLTITSRIHPLRMLNRDEKTVARILLEENRVPRRKGGGHAVSLGNRAIVLPVRGYQKAARKIIRVFRERGLAAATRDPLLNVLAITGQVPGSYSSKLNLQLEPQQRADHATRTILIRLLDIIRENEAGTRQGTDTEFLHDFRVAIRRTRSALSQIKGVLPVPVLQRYKAGFAWLGQMTSPSRDLDVYLLKFDDYKNSLPASAQADIEPLRDFLIRHQAIEHRNLLKALDSARYRRLLQDWDTFLKKPVNERSTLPNARRPVSALACERIWKVYKRILREGRAIAAGTPAEALHELRKTAKKLRYLMEFFQSLFPPDKIKDLIRVLKILQDNLGDFQDYEVQVQTLKAFSRQMVDEHAAPPETLLAMGMLIEGLEQRQHRAREEFADRFQKFSAEENRALFRELFTGCSAAQDTPL